MHRVQFTLRFLSAALVFTVMTGSALAQGTKTLLGVSQDDQPAQNRGTPPVTPPAPGLGPVIRAADISPVLAKIKAEKLLTEAEFVQYVRAVEAKNPGKTWAHIGTKMHQQFYSADATLVFFGIPLFKTGPENAGWESVDLLGGSPKFIQADDGKKVDIAHAYAGVRALCNRNRVSGSLMGNVNTGWGDSMQVVGGRIESVAKYVKGAFTFDYNKSFEGMDQWGESARFKPDDQVRGNTIGMQVQEYLRKNRTGRLSDGYAQVLNE